MNERHRGIGNSRPGFVVLVFLVTQVCSTVWAIAALPDTSSPSLQLDRTILTHPFVNDPSVSTKDGEGSAYVPMDHSLWLIEDNGRSAYEVNPDTGYVKRVVDETAWEAAPKFGGGPVAGPNRDADLESMAYDEVNDILYAFSGPCCTSSSLPTSFRLMRDGSGRFQVESYQPLPSGANYTGAAWNPADGKVYVGVSYRIRTYDYVTSTAGPIIQIPNLTGITGMDFAGPSDGYDLFVTTNAETLRRVDWISKTLVPGWTFDLTPFGVRDSRAVELIRDQLYVFDGADGRSDTDPLKYGVFVLDVIGPPTAAPAASFAAAPTLGDVPLIVTFTDTSTGGATGWFWDFGDGTATSTQRNPTHIYDVPGSYVVSLTASNSIGESSATAPIEVSSSQLSGNLVGNPDFESDTSGWGTAGSGTGVTLTRAQPGHSGAWAALVTNGSSSTKKCVLNDIPNWVATTQASIYNGSVWVRADAVGAVIKITFRELNGGSLVGSRVVKRTLTASWQELTLTYTPASPGSSTLDLQVFVPKASAPPGICFYADDASITPS